MAHNVNRYHGPSQQIQYLDQGSKDEKFSQNTKVIVYLPIKADMLWLWKGDKNFGFRLFGDDKRSSSPGGNSSSSETFFSIRPTSFSCSLDGNERNGYSKHKHFSNGFYPELFVLQVSCQTASSDDHNSEYESLLHQYSLISQYHIYCNGFPFSHN